MTNYKELYLPFYFNWLEMTEELTDAELGALIRALLDNFSERKVPSELPDKMRIIYKFMLDSAVRTHKNQRELSEKRRDSANIRWGKKELQSDANECKRMQSDAVKEKENENEKENVNVNGNGNGNEYGSGYKSKHIVKQVKKERFGDFDAEEAFRLALERSYGKEGAAIGNT